MNTPHLKGRFLERFLAGALSKNEEKELKAHLEAGPCEECADGLSALDDGRLDSALADRIERQIETASAEPEDPEVVERGFQNVMRLMRN